MRFGWFIISVITGAIVLSGCGGGASGTSTTTGYLVDSPIAGVSYECGDKKGTTDSQGKFECDKTPIVFKIGALVIGRLNSFTSDQKVYPQDLVGVSRANFTDSKLIALTRLLQSLDDDGDYNLTINISSNAASSFTEDVDFDESKLDDYANDAGVNLVSKDVAIEHLRGNISNAAHHDISVENISSLATFKSDVLTFNDEFLGESDESRYYALACSQTTNTKGQEVAHFDLEERHFTPTTINHLTIDNTKIFTMDKRLFIQYPNEIISEYTNLADVWSLIMNAALVAIDTTLGGHKSRKVELWFHAGEQFPGSSATHSRCDGTWRDIDSISDIWYNTRLHKNLWLEMNHELVGGRCTDSDVWVNLFAKMQLEVTEQTKDDVCGTYYLNN